MSQTLKAYLAAGVQLQHPSMLGINTRKISAPVAAVVADALYEHLKAKKELMPDKLDLNRERVFNSAWSHCTLKDFEDINLDDTSLERTDFKLIIKELISIANFWKLAASV